MQLKNFKGFFDTIETVIETYPQGGSTGDFIVLNGRVKEWNPTLGGWDDPVMTEQTPVRATETIYGDLEVHHDLTVGGILNAKMVRGRNAFRGVFASEESLNRLCPNPSVGEWAMVFAYTTQPEQEEPSNNSEQEPVRTSETSETTANEEVTVQRDSNALFVGYIFICEEGGTWKNTGFTGGFDGTFEALQAEKERAEEVEGAILSLIPEGTTEQNKLVNVSGVNTAVSVETTRAQGEEDAIKAKIPSAASSENKLADKNYVDDVVSDEATARRQDMAAEGQARERADGALGDAIDSINAKIPSAASSENKLTDKNYVDGVVSDEQSRAQGAEQTLQENIDTEASTREQKIAAETARAEAAEATKADADNVYTKQQTDDAVRTEKERAEAAEATKADADNVYTKQETDTAIAVGVQTEKNRAQTAEGQLRTDLTSETIRATRVEGTLQDNIEAERTRAQATEGTLQDNIEAEQSRAMTAEADINAKIPAQASVSNQLADKDFVNSSINTATADFKGTYSSYGALSVIPANKNDYGYVEETDSQGNLILKRYKYVEGRGWVYEYQMNNSGFTADEWAAIKSGATSERLANIEQSISTETLRAQGAENAINAKIAALAAGIAVVLSFDKNVIYKGVATNVVLTGTMINGEPTEMKLMDGSTVIKTSSSSPITETVSVNINNNSKTFKVVGTSDGVTISKEASVSARYPIYYGFAASASALAAPVLGDLNKYSPTTTAAHTYSKTNNSNGQHFYILVPSDIAALSQFSMGGAPFVMTSSTEVINGITYKVYTSGNTYNAGTEVTVVAS